MRKLFPGLLLTGLLLCCTYFSTHAQVPPKKKAKAQQAAAVTSTQQSEFADMKYVDMSRQKLMQFESGNIDAWAEQFADNIVYQWSSGDSLVGRQAIVDYWKNRRANVVESIDIENDIWLPIKVNIPQRGPDMPGVWVLNWHQFTTKYKNGKTLTGWVHTDMHYNMANKVDRVIQYIDRAPINEVSKSQ